MKPTTVDTSNGFASYRRGSVHVDLSTPHRVCEVDRLDTPAGAGEEERTDRGSGEAVAVLPTVFPW